MTISAETYTQLYQQLEEISIKLADCDHLLDAMASVDERIQEEEAKLAKLKEKVLEETEDLFELEGGSLKRLFYWIIRGEEMD